MIVGFAHKGLEKLLGLYQITSLSIVQPIV